MGRNMDVRHRSGGSYRAAFSVWTGLSAMWRYIAGALVTGSIGAVLVFQATRSDGDVKSALLVALVLIVPFLGWFASRFLVHGGVDGISRLRGLFMKKWNGVYYEYANVHLRAIDHDGSLVFVESDILKIIEQPKSTTLRLFGPTERVKVPGTRWTGLTRTGCERLLLKCPHAQAKGLLLFLQREAFDPWERRRQRN